MWNDSDMKNELPGQKKSPNATCPHKHFADWPGIEPGTILWQTRDYLIQQRYTYVQMVQCINILKPTGHVMHQQFNIQQLYALPTLYLCVLYLSENKQRLVPLIA